MWGAADRSVRGDIEVAPQPRPTCRIGRGERGKYLVVARFPVAMFHPRCFRSCWPSTDWWPATCCARRAGPGTPGAALGRGGNLLVLDEPTAISTFLARSSWLTDPVLAAGAGEAPSRSAPCPRPRRAKSARCHSTAWAITPPWRPPANWRGQSSASPQASTPPDCSGYCPDQPDSRRPAGGCASALRELVDDRLLDELPERLRPGRGLGPLPAPAAPSGFRPVRP
jgi:hypothetical protein